MRKEGFGDLDIYKVTFHDIENQVSVIKGLVSVNDTLEKDIDATVSISDAKTNEQLDEVKANIKSGKYVFSVNPGKYILTVTSPGYEDFKEVINVYDKSDYIFEIEKNIQLQKPGLVVPIPPKNIKKK